ncbi:hypothetical protein RKD48_005920 [Streptomyces ambofaciens]
MLTGGRDQQEDVAGLDGDVADVEGPAVDLREGPRGLRVRVPGPHRLLQGEGETDRGDQGREPGCAAQGAIGEPFRPDGDGGGDDHCADEHQGQGDQHGGAVGQDVHVDRERAEGAGHEDLAVGEVDELDDAVDHCVADGDKPVHGSQ